MTTTQGLFQPVNDNRALSEKIIAQITDALLKEELRPGDKLPPERELAEQFGVSRTVVRDAVKILAGRGILQVRHGAGIFVATSQDTVLDSLQRIPLHDAVLGDLFEVRKVLETQSAELAAQRRSQFHLDRITEILKDAHQHTYDIGVLSLRDAQFHLAISEATQNLVLVKLTLTLLDLLSRSRHDTLSIPGRAALSLADHERIVRAIADRDASGARQAMLAHLTSVESSIQSLRKPTND